MKFLVSLVTPFDQDQRVDLARLRAHVLWLVAEGIDGFVPTAFTGELPYLSLQEREAIHRTVIDAAPGRAVYPCTWDASPASTRYLTEAAREQGAAGALLPPPLLYALDDGALRAWFRPLAEVGIPLIAMHDPRTIATPIQPGTYAALRDEGLVSGLLDASEDIWRIPRIAGRHTGDTVLVSGDRVMGRLLGTPGVTGFVSDLANAWPSFCLRLARAGEAQLEDALVDRANRVGRAGGLRVLKALLRMACRSPLLEPDDEVLLGLPPAEVPG